MRIIHKIVLGLIIITLTNSCKSDYSNLKQNIDANLFLASSIDNENGEMIGEGDEFVIMDNGWVEASLDLSDYLNTYPKDLLIHLDWVDELGNSFFKKKQILKKGVTKLNTAVSIAPELRKSGEYILNVYVFRELIASKKFKLHPTYTLHESIQETITISTRANKKTFKNNSKNVIIHLMDAKWLKASVKLKNAPKLTVKNVLYQLNWLDARGDVFYKKKFSVNTDAKKEIDCSIEVASNKKELGNYTIQLLLFDKLIANKNFTLKKEHDATKVKANVTLYKKSVKNNKIGVGTDFIMLDKNKVRVSYDVSNCFVYGKKEPLYFKVVWVNTENKAFYTKRLSFKPKKDIKELKSSISIAPSKKRKSGKYKVQLYLFNQLISESSFNLHKV